LQIKNNQLQNELDQAYYKLEEYLSPKNQYDFQKATNTLAREGRVTELIIISEQRSSQNHIISYPSFGKLESTTSHKINLFNQAFQDLDLMTINELKESLVSVSEQVKFLNTLRIKLNQIHTDINTLKSDAEMNKIVNYILPWLNIAITANAERLGEAETVQSKIQSLIQSRTRDISDIFSLNDNKQEYNKYGYNEDYKNKNLDQFEQTVSDMHRRNQNLKAKQNPSNYNWNEKESDQSKNYIQSSSELSNSKTPSKYYQAEAKRSGYVSLRRIKSRRMLDEKIHLLAETPENMDYEYHPQQDQNALMNTQKLGQILNQNMDYENEFNDDKENSLCTSVNKTSALEQFNNMKFEWINNEGGKQKHSGNSKYWVPAAREKLPAEMNRERYLLKDKINQQYM
jgi:hypothetical protein